MATSSGRGTSPQNFHLMSGVGIYPTLLVTTITIAAIVGVDPAHRWQLPLVEETQGHAAGATFAE